METVGANSASSSSSNTIATNLNKSASAATFDSLLRSVYYDPTNPGSFTGAWSLYSALKQQLKPAVISENKITLQSVREWLAQQSAAQLHAPAAQRFTRRRFRVERLDEQWQVDLAFVVRWAPQNRGIKYLLICIDVLSKFLWIEPVRDKSGAAVAKAFQAILDRAAPRKPETVFSDQGTEFIANQMQAIFKKYNIKHFKATNTATKAAIAERVIRTFMNSLTKYMTAFNTQYYLPVVQKLVDRYNGRFHRSIKMRPVDVRQDKPDSVEQAWTNLYQAKDDQIAEQLLRGQKKYKYAVGDQVRVAISRVGNPFYKGYLPSWTDEIFVVSRRLPIEDEPLYKLIDPQTRTEIHGTYYEAEMQPVAGNFSGNDNTNTTTTTKPQAAATPTAAPIRFRGEPGAPVDSKKITRTGRLY